MEIDTYIEAGWREIEKAAQAQDENPPAVIKRLRELKQTQTYGRSRENSFVSTRG